MLIFYLFQIQKKVSDGIGTLRLLGKSISKAIACDTPINEIINSFQGIACVKKIPTREFEIEGDIGGYSWKSNPAGGWITVSDKMRPTLSLELNQNANGKWTVIYKFQNRVIEEEIQEPIDNSYDIAKQIQLIIQK